MKQKLLIALLLFAMTVCSIPVFSGCDSYEKTRYISTPEDLLLMKEGGSFVLDNDIDCGGLIWKSIDVSKKLTLDGNGYSIKNLKISSDKNTFGLIGECGVVTIKNLALTDFTIQTNFSSSNGQLFVGGFVGLGNSVEFENCFMDGRIDVSIKNNETYVGGFIGYNVSGEFNNCLTCGEISIHYDNASFNKASVAAGGFTGHSGSKNSVGGLYGNRQYNCVSLISIDVDTSTSASWSTTTNVGGFSGESTIFTMENCLSAPKKLYASTFVNDDVEIGGIQIIGTGKIGAFVGKIIYKEGLLHNYYCTYNDDTLTDAEKEVSCCDYEKLNGSEIGNAVNLPKTTMLSKEVMGGEYTYTDANGEVKDTFLSFDETIWRFGYEENGKFVLPKLKIFD